MVNQASRWNAVDYSRNAHFVPALGAAAVALLNPQPGELILDIGCGDGALTAKLVEAGAKVVGLDASPDMVEAARKRGIDAFVADAQSLDLENQAERFGQFDAAFSNAALHWMLDRQAVARGIFNVLKAGGRFAGEMGGEGNLEVLRRGLREELAERGYPLPAEDPQWYASAGDFARIYTDAGFTDIEVQLIDRPTPLPGGLAAWVKTFRAGLFDIARVPEAMRDEIAEAVEQRLAPELRRDDGICYADYVRLRFSMRKPA